MARKSISRPLKYIPDRMFVKLRYMDIMMADILPGNINKVTMFRNSLNAPREAGGHKPLNYNEFCPNLYGKYRVFGIKYSITMKNRGISEAWYLAVRAQNTMVLEQNLQTMMERQDAKVKQGGRYLTIKGYMSVAKTAGVPNSEIHNEQLWSADYNADPVRQAYLYIYMAHSNAQTVRFDGTIRLTYYAELYNRMQNYGSVDEHNPDVLPWVAPTPPNPEVIEEVAE